MDFAALHTGGKGASDAFLTHCHRELLHGQWKILLDDEFLEAYQHGIVIECCDGIRRRFYFRIFTYSADYPEKYASPLCSWALLMVANQIELSSVAYETWAAVLVQDAASH